MGENYCDWYLELLGKTEIDKFDVAGQVQQEVLWFEVSINDTSRVEVIECFDHASRVEARRRVVKIPSISV